MTSVRPAEHPRDPLYEVVVEEHLVMTARDGTALVADVFRPDAPGRHPTLVMRTPYGRRHRGQLAQNSEVTFYPQRGYVVVIQDVRGRGESQGRYRPFAEGPDTYDAIEWAASLPWSDGNVGMVGQSYLASAQYAAAPLRPPSLRVMSPVAGAANHHLNSIFRTGVFELRWRLAYFTAMERATYARAGTYKQERSRLDSYVLDPAAPLSMLTDESYRHLPLKDWGTLLRGDVPYVAELLEHDGGGPYWQERAIESRAHEIDTPMLHVGSWYDAFISDTLRMFTAVRANGRTEQARRGQRLIVGPWGHLQPYTEPTTRGAGDIDFGEHARISLHDVQLRWFDHHLLSADRDVVDEPPITIFVMGTNEWRHEYEWPLARTQYTPLYLTSADSERSLSFEQPGPQEEPDVYVYDPKDPVPTLGGTIIGEGKGVRDQRPIQSREDLLLYTGEVLEANVEITGPVVVQLFASSSAPDTDFTAKLIDVHPDGYAQNIVDGIVRARFRDSLDQPALMEPGTVYEFTIDLWATSHVFLAGHRMQLEIASSNFPRYDRNQNTGHPFGYDAEVRSAQQSVLHDAAHPSHILLPIIPT